MTSPVTIAYFYGELWPALNEEHTTCCELCMYCTQNLALAIYGFRRDFGIRKDFDKERDELGRILELGMNLTKKGMN